MKTFFKGCGAYPWCHKENLWFRGYVFEQGQVFPDAEGASWLKAQLTQRGLEETLRDIHGAFCLVLDEGDRVIFAVDRIRSFPIFYAIVNGELYLGDDANAIVAALPRVEMDPLSEEEYLATKLYVTGKETLIKGLFQVRTFTICEFSQGSDAVQERPYYTLAHRNLITDEAALKVYAEDTYRQLAKQMVAVLNGRTAVIPLSGGADSRLLLSMLRQENYEKVLCFTYGPKGQREAGISKAVAAHFGYPWVQVIYNKDIMKQRRNNALLRAFEDYTFSFTSTPHIQDFIAIQYMKEHNMLPEDSVFIPGHTAIIADVPEELFQQKIALPEIIDIFKERFYYRKKLSDSVLDKLLITLKPCDPKDMEGWAAQVEQYNIQERQSKFIENSVRAYEFFGYSWLMPMLDKCVFDLQERTPISLRYKRKLYLSLVDSSAPPTNDITKMGKIADHFRKKGLLRSFSRRATRIARYFKSDFCFEQMFPMGEYLWGCLTDTELFDVGCLLCKRQLEKTKALIRSTHER